MGSDHAPAVEVEGAVLAAAEYGVHVVLVGQSEPIEAALSGHETSGHSIEVHHASEVVGMEESAMSPLRRKKDSSVRIMANLMSEGRVSGIVSAGNTGAVMAATKVIAGSLSVVDRPALSTVLPTQKGKTLDPARRGCECRLQAFAPGAIRNHGGHIFALHIRHPPSPNRFAVDWRGRFKRQRADEGSLQDSQAGSAELCRQHRGQRYF